MVCSSASTSPSVDHPFELHFSVIKAKLDNPPFQELYFVQIYLNFMHFIKDIGLLHYDLICIHV